MKTNDMELVNTDGNDFIWTFLSKRQTMSHLVTAAKHVIFPVNQDENWISALM